MQTNDNAIDTKRAELDIKMNTLNKYNELCTEKSIKQLVFHIGLFNKGVY